MERSRHEQPGFARRVGATRRVYTDNLFRDVPPLKSVDDPDAAGVFEIDEEAGRVPGDRTRRPRRETRMIGRGSGRTQ